MRDTGGKDIGMMVRVKSVVMVEVVERREGISLLCLRLSLSLEWVRTVVGEVGNLLAMGVGRLDTSGLVL